MLGEKRMPVIQDQRGRWYFQSKTYYVKLTLPDNRRTDVNTGKTNYQEACDWLAAYLKDPRKPEKSRKNQQKPIHNYLNEYLQDLSSRAGRSFWLKSSAGTI